METIQVVLDSGLLHATNRAARKLRVNRSALVRRALREHLKGMETLEKERRDREGYESSPARPGEFDVWDEVAAWPVE